AARTSAVCAMTGVARMCPRASSIGAMPGWSWSICGNPRPWWGKLVSALRAGGWLVLEDADGLRFDAEPAHEVFAAITGPWQRAARAAGWNPCYGRDLVADLQRAGLCQVAGRAHRD